MAISSSPTRCTNPPEGWECTRAAGHEGPCAAYPLAAASTGWASPTLGHVYSEVEALRDALGQHQESGVDESLRRLLDAIETADCEIGAVYS